MNYRLLKIYQTHFEEPHIFVKSPGRANIIGEHTDYNHGLVFPFAIQQHISFYIGPNKEQKLRMMAIDINEQDEVLLSDIHYRSEGWQRYLINVLVALGVNFKTGIDVVFGGNLPQGGGISSSSALTCGFLSGINQLFELGHSKEELIYLASQAENGIGLNGGTMDQTAILKGRDNQAMIIDFYTNTSQYINLPFEKHHFYLINSGQKHNLVNTEYNDRRKTCEKAIQKIKAKEPSVKTMRQITHEHINHILTADIEKKRCLHVLMENERVLNAAQSILSHNFENLGALLTESHWSLSYKYEVSTPEIDFLIEQSRYISNMLGSRIMGGGFGGCTINLSHGPINHTEFKKLKETYKHKTGLDISLLEVKPSTGVEWTKIEKS